jgi:copper chaperone CopZ
MKKLFAFALLFSVFSTALSAQTKAQLTAKISTPSVQCELCKKRIEEGLKRYDGVLSVNVNYRKKETTVKYLTDRTNEEIIKTAIANMGYDANEIAATKESYDALPKCCKKPDDGGAKKQ